MSTSNALSNQSTNQDPLSTYLGMVLVNPTRFVIVKMVLFGVTGGKLGRIFSLGLLLLVAARVSRVSGQQGSRPLAAMFSIHHRLCTANCVVAQPYPNYLCCILSGLRMTSFLFHTNSCSWCYSKLSRSNHTKWQRCGH